MLTRIAPRGHTPSAASPIRYSSMTTRPHGRPYEYQLTTNRGEAVGDIIELRPCQTARLMARCEREGITDPVRGPAQLLANRDLQQRIVSSPCVAQQRKVLRASMDQSRDKPQARDAL